MHAFAPLHSFIFSFSVPWRGNSGLFSGFGFWKDLLRRVDICANLQIIRRIHSNNAICNLRIHRLEIYIINLIIKLLKMHFKHLFLNDILYKITYIDGVSGFTLKVQYYIISFVCLCLGTQMFTVTLTLSRSIICVVCFIILLKSVDPSLLRLFIQIFYFIDNIFVMPSMLNCCLRGNNSVVKATP